MNSTMLMVLPGTAKYCGEFSRISGAEKVSSKRRHVLDDALHSFFAELRTQRVGQIRGREVAFRLLVDAVG